MKKAVIPDMTRAIGQSDTSEDEVPKNENRIKKIRRLENSICRLQRRKRLRKMETGDRKPDYGSDSENDELECKGMNIYEKEFYMEEKLENRAVYK